MSISDVRDGGRIPLSEAWELLQRALEGEVIAESGEPVGGDNGVQKNAVYHRMEEDRQTRRPLAEQASGDSQDPRSLATMQIPKEAPKSGVNRKICHKEVPM